MGNIPTIEKPAWFRNKYRAHCKYANCVQPNGTTQFGIGDWVAFWKDGGISRTYHEACWEHATGKKRNEDVTPSPVETKPSEPSQAHDLLNIDALAELLKGKIQPANQKAELDETRVIELILENGVRESSITLTFEGTERKLEGFVHKDVSTIAEVLAVHRNVYIWGAAGAGKTTMASQIATLLTSGALEVIQCGKLSPESSLKGFVDGHGNKQEQRFIEALQRECIIFLDEFDRWPSHLTTLLNSTLANGYIDARGHEKTITRHEKCYILAAGNTTMRGRDEYFPEAIAQEFSTIDRFFYFHVEYDVELERGIAKSINPKSNPWVKWVQKLRPEVMTGKHGKVVATPRASYEGAKLLLNARSLTVEQIADGTVFKGIDAATKQKLLEKFPLPEVDREVTIATA